VIFKELDTFKVIVHSEEHLVIETEQAHTFKVGDILYAVPRHICPTVALHNQCYIIENNKLETTWPVNARNRLAGDYE
jgi:D-serine deaminase-like pyridoxal phosphate-dependent protein